MKKISVFVGIVIFCCSVCVLGQFEDASPFFEDVTAKATPGIMQSSAKELEFLQEFGEDYGYDGKLEDIIYNDLTRWHGHSYLDYSGSSVYRESQVEKVFEDLKGTMYGNTHSHNPSSLNSENSVEKVRSMILKYFNASPAEYSVVFTSGTTGALHTVSETFPWSEDSRFYYLRQNHNSVLGMREFACKEGAVFKAVTEEELNMDLCEKPDVCKEMCDKSCDIESLTEIRKVKKDVFNLFAFPAEDNFAGVLYPLEWIEKVQSGKAFGGKGEWKVVLDAAAFVPTQKLDLGKYKPDFVAMSFYKMFGYPTGMGALIMRNDAANQMRKLYWGGGTVTLSSADQHFCAFSGRPCTKFEDGTLNFLSIKALEYGFESFEELGIEKISKHVHTLTKYLSRSIANMKHSNGAPLAEVFGKHFSDSDHQGSIVSFTLKKADGSPIGYYDFQHDSAKKNIHIRTGCHCNPGACYGYLGIADSRVQELAKLKNSCSDEMDMVDGKPLGAIRASIGYLTSFNDIQMLIEYIESYLE